MVKGITRVRGDWYWTPRTLTAPWRLIGAILTGVPWLPLAACHHHDPQQFDDRIDGETRQQHHQRHAAVVRSLLAMRGTRGAVSESLD